MEQRKQCLIRGNLLKELYRKESDNYAIKKFLVRELLDGELAYGIEIGQDITIVGYALPDSREIPYEITGEWIKHPQYGWQLRVTKTKELLDGLKEKTIKKYLTKGPIKGITEKNAECIVNTFGEQTLKVLNENPLRISEVAGIPKQKAKAIAEEWTAKKSVGELMTLLMPAGISASQCMQISKRFGVMAMDVIQTDPWRLMECKGIPFSKVDDLVKEQVIRNAYAKRPEDENLLQAWKEESTRTYMAAMQEQKRIVAASAEVLMQHENNTQDLGMLPEEFIPALKVMLGRPVVSEGRIAECLKKAFQDGSLRRSNYSETGATLYYRKETYEKEYELAKMLYNLSQSIPAATEIEKMRSCPLPGNITLAPEQALAVRTAMMKNLLVLTGGPGTGKTTTLNVLVHVLESAGKEVCLMATSGKAANRMIEATNRYASTLDSRLKLQSDEDGTINEFNSLIEEDVTICDECSMLDLQRAYALAKALPKGKKLILVGDIDQLPSVGAGAVLRDLIQSNVLPVVRLSRIYRQQGAEGTSIVDNAYHINEGNHTLMFDDAFTFREMHDTEEMAKEMAEAYIRAVGAYGLFNVACLLPTRSTQNIGVEPMNALLQQRLNPPDTEKGEISYGQSTFRTGDYVMNTRNNPDKDVVNGDVGTVSSAYYDSIEKAKAVVVDFGSHKETYKGEEIADLSHAYAMTVHKSQGSEYAAVIIGMHNEAGKRMLKRNLLYTSVTRSKRKVQLFGQKSAINRCIDTPETYVRKTCLANYLRGFAGVLVSVGKADRKAAQEINMALCSYKQQNSSLEIVGTWYIGYHERWYGKWRAKNGDMPAFPSYAEGATAEEVSMLNNILLALQMRWNNGPGQQMADDLQEHFEPYKERKYLLTIQKTVIFINAAVRKGWFGKIIVMR